MDYRIHFGLNCGAKSCPPVKWFTLENYDDEMRIVSMAWVEQDDNVKVDFENRTLWLSQICSWYAYDFGPDSQALARTLLQHARGVKKEQLEKLLEGTFSVKYLHYDWSTNASKSAAYSQWHLGLFLT